MSLVIIEQEESITRMSDQEIKKKIEIIEKKKNELERKTKMDEEIILLRSELLRRKLTRGEDSFSKAIQEERWKDAYRLLF